MSVKKQVSREQMPGDRRIDQMKCKEHREKLGAAMKDDSILICYAGIPVQSNSDDYYPFEVDSNYFWLTGSERERQALVMTKHEGRVYERLYIERQDDFMERWTGKMPKTADVAALSGMDEENIFYIEDLPDRICSEINYFGIRTAYFDTYRNSDGDADRYPALKALEFASKYPGIVIVPMNSLISPLRAVKDSEEAADMREAVNITRRGLERVMRSLRPGMKEYQVQAVFENSCRGEGTVRMAFPTIAASGSNACSMHYITNRDTAADGELILLDLGAKYNNYCSDISRTYPVNGKFSPRQRQIYDLVLKANRAVINEARPGLTVRDLQQLTRKILGEGLVELGLLSDPSEVSKYYMHSVGHSLGIDAHDMTGGTKLCPGFVVTDEPGLYIDEEGIGIRIEDDLLITENGCEVLSKDIIKDPDEIEAFMAASKR